MTETLVALIAVVVVTVVVAWVSGFLLMMLAGLIFPQLELEIMVFGMVGLIAGGLAAFVLMFNWAVHYV